MVNIIFNNSFDCQGSNWTAETATTGNLLPNAGTGQTSVQHSNSTIDGINSSNWFYS